MNNELANVTKAIALAKPTAVAVTIYDFCTKVTPHFYKQKSAEDVKAEIGGIKLLTEGIQPQVLAEMCQMAVSQYGVLRSNNPKAYFDINYIMMFYVRAFNHVNRDSVDKSGCDFLESKSRNHRTGIVTELYSNYLDEDDNPYRSVTVQYIPELKGGAK
jgi:hypothetical protein